jgi:hypothetical protein
MGDGQESVGIEVFQLTKRGESASNGLGRVLARAAGTTRGNPFFSGVLNLK